MTEEMLERMYVADFFAPSLDVLEALADAPPDVGVGSSAPTLGIGNLRGRGGR